VPRHPAADDDRCDPGDHRHHHDVDRYDSDDDRVDADNHRVDAHHDRVDADDHRVHARDDAGLAVGDTAVLERHDDGDDDRGHDDGRHYDSRHHHDDDSDDDRRALPATADAAAAQGEGKGEDGAVQAAEAEGARVRRRLGLRRLGGLGAEEAGVHALVHPAVAIAAAALAVSAPAGSAPAGAHPLRASSHVRAGARLGSITIPRLHETEPLYQGITAAVLADGPGHYAQTPLPGRPGTVGIAGHRVTHTHPFLRLNLLRRGDAVIVRTRDGVFRYRVYRMAIVRPTGTWIFQNGPGEHLVLTACHPPRRATFRLVVFAKRM
jgi:sortase A